MEMSPSATIRPPNGANDKGYSPDFGGARAGCVTPSSPLARLRRFFGSQSVHTGSRRARHLAQIPEQARHDAEGLFGDGEKNVLIGRVLGTARIGMWHPDRRQAKSVGKHIVGQRAAEIRQYSRGLPRGLPTRLGLP